MLLGIAGKLGADGVFATCHPATTGYRQTSSPPATASEPAEGKTLKAVTVKGKAEAQLGKDAIRATTTTSAKGTQDLRDIPQSITVVTEKLIVDRNIDTVKEAFTTPPVSLSCCRRR